LAAAWSSGKVELVAAQSCAQEVLSGHLRGMQGMKPARESAKEGTGIVRKLFGLALLAGLVAVVKKYLDTNPDAKRQVKEQANKAMGQAKHLAEEAGEKVKARASQAQDAAERPLSSSGTSESTSSTTPMATPNGPTTGAPTTL
jgi:hypothetical protein